MITTSSRATLSNGTLIDDLCIVDILGKGAYGQVYLGKHNEKKKLYAIKSLHHKNKQRSAERMEIGLHGRVSGHPNIIQLKRVIRNHDLDWTHVVLEYSPEGDLFTAITERDLYAGNHPLIRKVFLQLIDAVAFCHDNNVYHRDLKPENILVFDGGRTLKLADFGLATTNTVSIDYGCGSIFYYSPECQGDSKYSESSVGYATASNDIWALGIILINLTTGRNPWKQASVKDETFRAYMADPDFLLKILPISRELNTILKRILCVDPLKRITTDELKERILHCKYFTKTAEVDRWENLRSHRNCQRIHRPKKMDFPPSPPATPSSDRSRSTSPAIWQQRVTPELINKENSNDKIDDDNANSLLTNMVSTLVV